MSYVSELLGRLRTAGVEPDDPEELRLKKQLLMFAMALTIAVPIVWVAIYRLFGVTISTTLPILYLFLSLANLGVYLVTRDFSRWRLLQLALFLFFPFVQQLSLGDFITASGYILWGLLAPVGAILLYGARDSIPWFFAFAMLILMAAGFDYQLVGGPTTTAQIPQKVSAVFFALNFFAISSMVYALLRNASIERDKSKARLEEAHRLLQAEQERSERLLLNILPGPVAERLKQENGTIADGFADVTVMFADIVNFTTIAEGMSPNQIFAMLNKVFSSFDGLAEKYGLEKIKTIGDAYMVAGGLDEEDTRNYSEAIAHMALDMRDLLANDLTVNDQRVAIRMGIGTGPVVAGVVGKKKFIYDLWGDTVNLASRITAESVPGMIQVDVTTYRRLRNRFEFDAPQTVYLKGKGDTIVYRLQGRKREARAEAAA
ncbi:MAG: adenylate/guanylate cyclase domain-containing protein [Burkholderiales bacterium]|nr:adenylate/guanylate cyclase domain-containing protein [Burkholderiales bacterium]